MNEIIILLDDTLEEIHAREKIREVLRAKEHINIGNLPVDVDVTHTLPKCRTLAVILTLCRRKLFLVFLEAFERFVQLCAALFMRCDRRICLLIQNPLLL